MIMFIIVHGSRDSSGDGCPCEQGQFEFWKERFAPVELFCTLKRPKQHIAREIRAFFHKSIHFRTRLFLLLIVAPLSGEVAVL